MHKKIAALVFASFIYFSPQLYAQNNLVAAKKTVRVGIFAPLYLDSVFNGNSYRYSRNFPRFILPGLDFVQGAQIALDSLPDMNFKIEAGFYDSKSTTQNIGSLISQHKLDSLDLIIGSVKDEDYFELANLALLKNIPFISATFPNDAGVTGNPFLVIVNSTLKAHCEAIFAYLLQKHGTDKIIFCRKPGSQEDRVASYFKALNEPDGSPLLQMEIINIVDSNFNAVKYKLDSTRHNIMVGASLDEYFAYNLSAALADLNKTYPTTLIGMPNWDGFKSYGKKNSFTDFPVYFTSPFFNTKYDEKSRLIQAMYLKKYKGVPSDYTYKGFESIRYFIRLLSMYPEDYMSHLNDNPHFIFSVYNFKPVFNNGLGKPDYFENKHLYFLKLENGKTSMAW